MKNLIFILVACIQMTAFGQSKEETEDWIKEKIEMYGLNNSDIRHSHTIEFKDENVNDSLQRTMFINHDLDVFFSNGDNSNQKYTYSIQLNQIGLISFKYNKSNIWLNINCVDNNDCVSQTHFGTYSTDNELKNSITFILSKSIENEDLPNRLKKAFHHLITINGGEVVKEVF
jgi:hypothetical protein